MEETTSQVAVAEPRSLSEFRAAKAARATATAEAPPAKAAPAEGKTENAGEPANPQKETQEKQKRAARTAEERAADLRAAGRQKEADEILAKDAEAKEFEAWKAGKADREKDAEELRTLRAKASAAAPAHPVSRETTAAPPSADPNRPKLKDFLVKPENKDVDYADVVEQWKDADDAWRETKRRSEESQSKEKENVQAKMTAARSKYADFDRIAAVPIATMDNIRTLVREYDNALDVLYSVGNDEKERQRILALSPARQLIELGYIARNLASNGTANPPEKPKPAPPVSRTPPPPRVLGGIAPKEESNGIPKSLSEFRANKAARRAS